MNRTPIPSRSPASFWIQMINGFSLSGGASIALLVMSYPWTIAFTHAGLREPLFVLSTLAASGGFIYGLGYRPVTVPFRYLITPWTVLPLIMTSLGWLAYALYIGPVALSSSY